MSLSISNPVNERIQLHLIVFTYSVYSLFSCCVFAPTAFGVETFLTSLRSRTASCTVFLLQIKDGFEESNHFN